MIYEKMDEDVEMLKEYRQVSERIDKLINYIKHNINRDKAIEIRLKEQQLNAMLEYRNILEIRMKLEGIKV